MNRYGLRGTARLGIRSLLRRTGRVALFFAYQGFGRQCPFCRLKFRRFIAYPGEPSPLFANEHIVGGGPMEESFCPFCTSSTRERHVFLFLKACTSVFTEPVRMLHLAPEKNLQRILRSCGNIRYISADLGSPLASVQTDITALSFADDIFDVVICNHVLEHIPDDRQAMREIIRVLKPGGWAILQVPIATSRAATEEAPSITSPNERLRLFGQTDHVRVYAEDYIHRLEDCGFVVDLHSLSKQNGEPYAKYFGLLRDENIYLAKKPPVKQAKPQSRGANEVLVLQPALQTRTLQ
jgi:SAM-dependent methyltransferase